MEIHMYDTRSEFVHIISVTSRKAKIAKKRFIGTLGVDDRQNKSLAEEISRLGI